MVFLMLLQKMDNISGTEPMGLEHYLNRLDLIHRDAS
jgi:hypothetical protein